MTQELLHTSRDSDQEWNIRNQGAVDRDSVAWLAYKSVKVPGET